MRLGVDLGGTKIEAAVIGPDNGVRWRKRLPTPCGNYTGTLETIHKLIELACQENGLPSDLAVGIGVPGSRSPASSLMRNCNSTVLNGKPLLEDLLAVLQRPVRIANDADCFALSEAKAGAGQGAKTVFGVILGTGMGGGIVINGQLLTGANGIAGEWGHNPAPGELLTGRTPRPCYCRRNNCLETWLAGPSLLRSFSSNVTDGKAASVPDVKDWILRKRAGDTHALQIWQDYTELLAQALSVVINIIDPDVIVMGGGISNIDEIYCDIPAIWHRWIFSDIVRTRLVKAECGDSSGVIGAAWLWPDD
ncbi:MAG TPA: ROK family protein [Pseudomonadales bacterium]|nr:ROK family protein [Pseudomonadales bacterium]